jgi:hypothetical protein
VAFADVSDDPSLEFGRLPALESTEVCCSQGMLMWCEEHPMPKHPTPKHPTPKNKRRNSDQVTRAVLVR